MTLLLALLLACGQVRADTHPGTIRGVCAIQAGPGNPFPGPCVSLLIILEDAKGNEVARTRTTPQGEFDFTAAAGSQAEYIFVSGSKFYEVIAPTRTVHGGDRVSLLLRQK
jgi:hypothetical protein